MAGIVNGLFAGRAGIQSHGTAIAVLADNIANSNTVAYKASRANFTDLLSQSIGGGGGSATAGNGSQVISVTPIFTQGTFESTGRGLDVAIDGDGFFVLGQGSGRFYSRAGNFSISTDGILINQNGLSVLGFPADGAGGLEELNVNNISQANIDTTAATITGNLDASTTPNATLPAAGSSFSTLFNEAEYFTNVDVFDSLGAQHSLTFFFFHTDDGEWTAQAYVNGEDVTGGTAGEPEQVGSDLVMTFDGSGVRTSFSAPDMTLAPVWNNGSETGDIEVNFDPFTQFSAPSSISSISQNGKGVGNIVSVSVQSDGTLFAQLDNGLTTSIGTVALATFANAEGLSRSGDSLYTESANSGEPVIGTPGSGKFGSTQSGSLELSTADIADDFIKLISLQRGFQGSARVITSIDDLLNEIINLA